MGQSLFGDEVLTYQIIDHGSLVDVLRALRAAPESTPPLHYALAWAAGRLSGALTDIRLPSLLAGTATVPLLLAVGRRIVPARAAWLARGGLRRLALRDALRDRDARLRAGHGREHRGPPPAPAGARALQHRALGRLRRGGNRRPLLPLHGGARARALRGGAVGVTPRFSGATRQVLLQAKVLHMAGSGRAAEGQNYLRIGLDIDGFRTPRGGRSPKPRGLVVSAARRLGGSEAQRLSQIAQEL